MQNELRRIEAKLDPAASVDKMTASQAALATAVSANTPAAPAA